MPLEITMPKLSDTMEEGTILSWRIKQGDSVARGDIIAEVETDKAAMEMEAFSAGTVTELRVPAGETVKVGTVLAVLATEGETPEPVAESEPGQKPESAAKPEPMTASEPAAAPEPTAPEPDLEPETVAEPETAPQQLATTAEPTPAKAPAAPAGGAPSHHEGPAVSPAARRLARGLAGGAVPDSWVFSTGWARRGGR